MTRNQILKSQLYETAAHNRAMESIAAGELAERSRSNKASESIQSERNRITQQRYEVQNSVDWYNAQTSRQRALSDQQAKYYEHMDRVQSLNQRRREWEDSMGQFYSRLSFDYKRMEMDNARRDREIKLKQAQLKSNNWVSMGKAAVEFGKIVTPFIPGFQTANSARKIAKQLFK